MDIENEDEYFHDHLAGFFIECKCEYIYYYVAVVLSIYIFNVNMNIFMII